MSSSAPRVTLPRSTPAYLDPASPRTEHLAWTKAERLTARVFNDSKKAGTVINKTCDLSKSHII